ncbi:MAG: helix-turn-helix domain-containing protein [Zetaproteobacteria bacterium]|nr:helix-turn-helix domain-containing protein [Zetaproteobacteria bacterium]
MTTDSPIQAQTSDEDISQPGNPLSAENEMDKNKSAPQSSASIQQHLGSHLAQERQRLGKNINQISSILRISTTHLHAIEAGDWSVLPGETYALGFAKQYAKHLQCDIADELEALRSNQKGFTRPLIYQDQPTSPNKKLAIMAGVFFLMLFIGANIFFYQSEEQGSPDASMPIANENIIAPSNLAELIISDTSTPTENSDNNQQQPFNEATVNNEATSNLDENLQKQSTGHHYLFAANNDIVWLQLYAIQGDERTQLHDVVLQIGESLNVTSDAAYLELTTGNAAELKVTIDNQPIQILDEKNKKQQVLRGFKLIANGNQP